MLFVVVVLLATSVEGVVFRSGTARQGISTRDPGIGGFEFSDDLVFEMSARSASACSRRCLRFGGCEAFTFIKPSRTCRGHSSIPTPGSAKTSSSGAETWAWSDCSASDLQPSYVTYEQSRIIGNELYISFVTDLQACFGGYCNGYEWCRFLVYEPAIGKCSRYDQTPRDVPAAWDPNDSQFNSYQRKCA
ncbi:hypothetical protein BaRGS_00005095 [Batillaria attramentaria]|uniref:Apple domain-containing protein n=1 Tax=Batillaria attramentaria TaxID=370345 RepID=A0ABD0LWM0_9CAEN